MGNEVMVFYEAVFSRWSGLFDENGGNLNNLRRDQPDQTAYNM